MSVNVRPAPPSPRPVAGPPRRSVAPRGRKPFRDNTRLILLGILVLLAALAALLTLASRSARLAPDFLTEFVLYALSATNLTILVALVFVLARNIVKLVVERRRGLPFARFRAKLVAVLLGMTIVPAVLVLLVGSEVIRNSVDRWFNAPMNDVLSSANAIAGDYYQEQERLVSTQAQRMARALAAVEVTAASTAVRDAIADDVLQQRVALAEVYRVVDVDGSRQVQRVADMAASALPRDYSRDSSDALAERAAASGAEARDVERLPGGGNLIRSAVPIRSTADGPVRGVVIASGYLTSEFASRARQMTAAYEDYQQLQVLKQPLAGVYLSFFLMLTLMILIGSTWMGLYLAKRITRPIQLLATAAKEIGAGHLDHRVVPETQDEFGSLIEAFNSMAGELAGSRRRLERSAVELERKHVDVEGRRRYVETILNRIATGVISVDAAGRIRTANSTAMRLLGVDASVAGLPVGTAFADPELKPLADAVEQALRSRADIPARDVSMTRGGRELHLAISATPLWREDGGSDGVVIVFDDVTHLIRAQRINAWREVARRLAHEIKNPLTPIQLSAERMRRHLASAPEPTHALVEECTGTIVAEVESLKALVDEFSQFARMPAPRATPTDVHALLTEVLSLYQGILTDVDIRTRFAGSLPKVLIDAEQIRRVMINLVDNAVEAMEQRGTIEIETQHDPSNNLVRIIVADDGPGIPVSERDKLFLPYYSTKRRGSGLGLAIVRRIVAEHGGSIDLTDNVPRGTRFAIELPA
jgi:two-component system, NtrC family, nitrogen regulation sensor histidine kinase NtrY